MAYATAVDLIREFSAHEIAQRLSDKAGGNLTAETLSLAVLGQSVPPGEQAIVAKALEAANQTLIDVDALMNGYLRQGGYTIPLSVVDAQVRSCALDIARYRLYDDGRPDDIRERYEDCIRWLEQVAAGKIELAANKPEASEDANVLVSRPLNFCDDRVFDICDITNP